MTESTPIVAFDQHGASVMAAILMPGDRTPTLHPLPPDLPTIHRCHTDGDVRCSVLL